MNRYHYRVIFTLNDHRKMTDCMGSLEIAGAVARKRIEQGATDVVIAVTDDLKSDEDDPSWPPLDAIIYAD